MFRNYFKIALRNLWRRKAFSAINIFGLAIGIATCLVIMLYVMNELSYDRFNEKADRIVRVVFKGSVQGEKMKESNVMPPVAQTLKSEYPEVLDATRLRDYGRQRITFGEKTFEQNRFAYVDSNFFNVFTLPFLAGDPKTALAEPSAIVISEEAAHKFFGNENAVGRVLKFENLNSAYKITGVYKDIPVNSHFHFDIFASMSTLPEAKDPSWMVSNFYTYLVLPAGYNYKQLEAKLPQVVEKHMGPQLFKAMGMTLSDFRKRGNDIGLFLQPLTDIHLRSDLMFDLEPGSNIWYVYIFGVIAIFMLLIACINFMNLSTAGASGRAREVGIRKVLGSVKMQLVKQFLVEAILLTSISFLLAIALVKLALPVFNNLAGKNLVLDFSAKPRLLLLLVLFNIIVGVLAGGYPAFFLSSFNPIAVLKSRLTKSKSNLGLRSGLVVFQFFISITLIVSTVVVYRQLNYIRNKELGYNKDQLMILPESWWLGKNDEAFRQQLQQDPRVVNISISSFLPAGPSNNNNFMVYPDDNPSILMKTLKYEVDANYIPTFGMKITAGRNFSKDFSTDSSAAILNETAAKEFGWGHAALGHRITRANNDGSVASYRVIGIIKDFHFRSLHERISPLVMVLGNNSGSIILKVKTRDIAGLVNTIKKQWDELAPQQPFYYSFMDDRFNNTYQSEQKVGRILAIFAGLTIFVASMGLFGLAMFTAQQRTKEIGIRKVLGASVIDVVRLLSKDFLKLVLVSNLIAWPVSWWAMNKWLQNFAYRIQIDWWIFAVAGILAVVIALITVSFESIKSALSNPVKTLRSE